MKLRTSVELEPSSWQIESKDKLCFLGSCFADNIGQAFAYEDGSSLVNPLGTIFHSASLAFLFSNELVLNPKAFVERDNHLVHLSLAKTINASSPQEFTDKVQALKAQLHSHIQQCKAIFISLGTAWHYYHLNSQSFVANCHKVPSQEFDKKLWSVAAIKGHLGFIVEHVKRLNPDLKIVLTVSPVKHLRDGLIQNNRSKAHLISAVHAVVEDLGLDYFPAFEMVQDELRDYRFYADDMAHPSSMAIEFIRHRFLDHFASDDFRQKYIDWQKLSKLRMHRVMDERLLKSHQLKISELEKAFNTRWNP